MKRAEIIIQHCCEKQMVCSDLVGRLLVAPVPESARRGARAGTAPEARLPRHHSPRDMQRWVTDGVVQGHCHCALPQNIGAAERIEFLT